MPKFTQDNRLMAVSTPLAKDALLLEQLTGTEGISELYQFQLELLAETTEEVPFDKLLGQAVTVTLVAPGGEKRYVNGLVSRFGQGAEFRGGPDRLFTRYTATVVPKLWLLTRRTNSRTFQQLTVPDILKKVLVGFDVSYKLDGTYEKRDYCIQYRETDFAFASRLMEEEGIFYYFTHSAGGHTMVVSDHPGGIVPVPGKETLLYDRGRGGIRTEERIYDWRKTQELRSGKQTLWDHCFEMPGNNLEAKAEVAAAAAVGTVSHKLKVGGNDALELYDYPGGYAQRFDGIDPGGGDRAADVNKILQDNSRTTRIRMEQETAQALAVVGESTVRHMAPGHKFTLSKHFNADGAYLITRVQHTASLVGQYQGEEVGDTPPYMNTFTASPAVVPYRPAQTTPKAVIHGTQSATVVGPSGEEIFTDKYGRIKVQFPWDREGKKDANSSCWVRVATMWAGKQWGAISIPRIGQEVLVAFEEGDPDRPIVVGSVYNAGQMPPYTLPANKTQSGIKSRSSLKGTGENFNELRFEDKKDAEQIYFHAEKNFDRVVENNDTLKVGFEKKDKGDQTIEVFNNQVVKVGTPQSPDGSMTTTVYKDRTATLTTGNEALTVKQGNRTTTLDMGNDKHQLKMGNREVLVDMGNDTLTIKMGNQTTKLNLGASSTEAMQSITLKVGQSSITVDQTGVKIKGLMVSVEGQVQTQVKGLMTDVKGTAMLTVGGGITMIG
ncbi:MAG: type VI secretion system tip protein VgrG [Gemmataceae bacterium]